MMSISRFLSLSAVSCTFALSVNAQDTAPQRDDPDITVRVERPRSGSFDRVFFAASPNSYVAVIRVGPTGRIDVLYPTTPSTEASFVKSSKRVAVRPLPSRMANGYGEVYAFASRAPFDFSAASDGDGWNSLHLATLNGATGEEVAIAFANEMSGPLSRVSMAAADLGPTLLVDRRYREATPRLAAFKARSCPTLSMPVGSSGGVPICSAIGKSGTFRGKAGGLR